MIRLKWLCWNCEKWNIGRIDIENYQVWEGKPRPTYGNCVNCDEKSEILIAVSSGKLPEDK